MQQMPQSSETPLRWFRQHPLVSTVLWVFGASPNAAGCEKVPSSRSNNRLSWVDEHGGQLNSYYGEGGVRTSVHNGVYHVLEKKDSEVRLVLARARAVAWPRLCALRSKCERFCQRTCVAWRCVGSFVMRRRTGQRQETRTTTRTRTPRWTIASTRSPRSGDGTCRSRRPRRCTRKVPAAAARIDARPAARRELPVILCTCFHGARRAARRPPTQPPVLPPFKTTL